MNKKEEITERYIKLLTSEGKSPTVENINAFQSGINYVVSNPTEYCLYPIQVTNVDIQTNVDFTEEELGLLTKVIKDNMNVLKNMVDEKEPHMTTAKSLGNLLEKIKIVFNH